MRPCENTFTTGVMAYLLLYRLLGQVRGSLVK